MPIRAINLLQDLTKTLTLVVSSTDVIFVSVRKSTQLQLLESLLKKHLVLFKAFWLLEVGHLMCLLEKQETKEESSSIFIDVIWFRCNCAQTKALLSHLN